MKKYMWWNAYVDDLGNSLFIEDVPSPLPLFSGFDVWHSFDRGAWGIMWRSVLLDILCIFASFFIGASISFSLWGVVAGIFLCIGSVGWLVPNIAFAMYPLWLQKHHYKLVAKVWARELEQARELFTQRSNEYLMDTQRGVVFKFSDFQVKDHTYYNAVLTHAYRYPKS